MVLGGHVAFVKLNSATSILFRIGCFVELAKCHIATKNCQVLAPYGGQRTKANWERREGDEEDNIRGRLTSPHHSLRQENGEQGFQLMITEKIHANKQLFHQ